MAETALLGSSLIGLGTTAATTTSTVAMMQAIGTSVLGTVRQLEKVGAARESTQLQQQQLELEAAQQSKQKEQELQARLASQRNLYASLGVDANSGSAKQVQQNEINKQQQEVNGLNAKYLAKQRQLKNKKTGQNLSMAASLLDFGV